MTALLTPVLVVYAGAVTVVALYYARCFLLLEIATDRQSHAVAAAQGKAAYWAEQASAESEQHRRAMEAHANYRRAMADGLLDLRSRHLDCEQLAAVDQLLRRHCVQPSPATPSSIEALVGDATHDE